MFNPIDKNKERIRRKLSIRKKISGTSERPRMTFFRSLKHVSTQIIDDTKGVTIVSAGTYENGIGISGKNVDAATKLGEAIAKRALDAGITTVVFDRSGYLYHGRVKAFADAARKAGLKF
ncbi:MAG TPA: 50S ribosomal protein L18 [Caldisericia bacterium]|nr:50S ribosomal protein L18 [Caldisericia bacterium]HPF49296.1 50S ribosomal protein L18 [Caldisericia bacterium]HPI84024.1 50S ribosomal protein L18 [Caldisericia bacterium]HPQ93282.1 50S ribosomal protein L18 [Caldisericia bacterium]HRV75336.1 50S ribosomal protein L18 [Caldisericia bacterium]